MDRCPNRRQLAQLNTLELCFATIDVMRLLTEGIRKVVSVAKNYRTYQLGLFRVAADDIPLSDYEVLAI